MFKSYFARETMGEVAIDRLAAARAAAKLKREKKAAAAAARIQGKIAAEQEREKMAETERIEICNQEEVIKSRIAKARKALGLRKNEDNPAGLCRMIDEWRMEARIKKWTHIHNCTSDCNKL